MSTRDLDVEQKNHRNDNIQKKNSQKGEGKKAQTGGEKLYGSILANTQKRSGKREEPREKKRGREKIGYLVVDDRADGLLFRAEGC